MAGTIPSLSLGQRLNNDGTGPLSGGILYFIQAGTVSTPQNAYKDIALTLPHPNPITLDAGGNIPQFFLADGQIKIRLTDKKGVLQILADNLQVVGPSSGGGGGGTVDPTTIIQTGYVISMYGTGTLAGFVRANSRTIGSSTSGATERANADTQALFQYLWNTDPNLPVSGGRGVSSIADWTANKTIGLPDMRARVLGGLADMGNSNVGSLASNTFTSGNAVTLGSVLGQPRTTLIAANLPAVAPTGTAISSFSSGNGIVPIQGNVSVPGGSPTSNAYQGANTSGATSLNIPVTGTVATTITMNNLGSGTGFDSISPTMLVTIYVKL